MRPQSIGWIESKKFGPCKFLNCPGWPRVALESEVSDLTCGRRATAIDLKCAYKFPHF
jgi:hypothetical protein